MTKPQSAPPSESYFASRLAEQARQEPNATPTTLDSLVESLGEYLTDKEVNLVVRAYKYAESAHTGQQAVDRLRIGKPEVESLRDVQPADLESAADVLTRTQMRRARHVVTENARVLAAEKALEAGDVAALGRLLSQSHVSLRDDYEVSCRELDFMAELVEQTPGVHGARMMGGGFGGCVLAVVDAERAEGVGANVAPIYAEETGRNPWFHVCRLSGAAGPVARNADAAA